MQTIEASPTQLVPVNPALPSNMIERRNSRGNLLGFRYTPGQYTARDLKEAIRAQRGLKGKELTCAVNEALKDERAARRVHLAAAVAELDNRGMTWDQLDIAKGNKTATIKFVRIDEVAPKAPSADEMLAALAGGDESRLAALKAILAAPTKPAINA